MKTIRMKDMSIEELNTLINACQTEITGRQIEQMSKLMKEFDDWLDRVDKAGLQAWNHINDTELTYWDVDLIAKE